MKFATICLLALAVSASALDKPIITLRLEGDLIEQAGQVPNGANGFQQGQYNKHYAAQSDHVFNCQYYKASTCKMPVASAHDHHDESVAIDMTYLVIDNASQTTETTSSSSNLGVKCDKTMVHKTQIFKYDATDYSGNKAEQVVIAFFVWDDKAPTIVPCAVESPIEATNAAYRDAEFDKNQFPTPFTGCKANSGKASASDEVDGVITSKMTRKITHDGQGDFTGIDFAATGSWEITYAVKDSSENHKSLTSYVKVQDTLAPVISVTGGDEVVECQSKNAYVDKGAKCDDRLDGTLPATPLGKDVSIDTKTKGTTVVKYNCKDAAGHSATTKQRSVTVKDTTKPEISMNGQVSITLWAGNPVWEPTDDFKHVSSDVTKQATKYKIDHDLSVNCADACDAYPSKSNTFKPAFDGMKPGTYEETYTCTDSVGLTNSLVRTITIVDKRLPLLVMNGQNPVHIEATPGKSYHDAGASCTDEVDGDLSTKVVVDGQNVNCEVPKMYKITYNCKDSTGNAAVQLTRTVIVSDNTAPTLYLNSRAFMVIEASFPYNDPGATAFDSLDGDLTSAITSNAKDVNPFAKNGAHVASKHANDMGYDDASTNGVYHIHYNVKDSENNAAKSISRTVVVKDTLPPVITLTTDSGTFGHDDSVKYNQLPFNADYSDENYQYLPRTSGSNIQNGKGQGASSASTGTGSFTPPNGGGYLALNEQQSASSPALLVGLVAAAAGLALFGLSKKRTTAKTFVMV